MKRSIDEKPIVLDATALLGLSTVAAVTRSDTSARIAVAKVLSKVGGEPPPPQPSTSARLLSKIGSEPQ